MTPGPSGSLTDDDARVFNAIDWARWVPVERAVLCFIRDGDSLLLIHKKTGLGAGKINAPGGRIEPGETTHDAAVRECVEETGCVPSGLVKAGELFFEFTDGYKLHGTVFFASSFTGEPVETREADPFWCAVDAVPYHDMWEDDRHWLPLALEGKRVTGWFLFAGDRMLGMRVETKDGSEAGISSVSVLPPFCDAPAQSAPTCRRPDGRRLPPYSG